MKLQRRSLLKLLAGSCLMLGPLTGVARAESQYEGPQTRPTADVLAPSLIKGPNYEVGPTVKTFDYLDHYNVKSDYGDFSAGSDAFLRRLLREIAAIAELKKITTGDAFGKAAGNALKAPVRAAGDLITDPVGTLSAIPEGIGSIFNRVSETVDRGGHSQYEDDSAKALLNVSSYKREYAQKLGVDPYSSNKVLQDELDSVAWAAAAGNMTLGGLSMVTGAVVLEVASDVRLLEQAQNIVTATPPAELSKQNRETLTKMGVPTPVVDLFLENHALSPRHTTLMVNAMKSMDDIPGTAAFIQYASGADTESAALLFQEMAELLAGYHAKIEKVKRIDFSLTLPAAVTAKGTVMLLPLDRVLWTERADRVTAGLAKMPAPELWLTGTASPRTAGELKKAKVTLVENV